MSVGLIDEAPLAIPFPGGRVRNRPWDPSAFCTACQDDSIVVVGMSRVGVEEFGPCPRCEAGFMCEFGWRSDIVERRNGRRERTFSQVRSPWGSAGFWHNRPGEEAKVPVRQRSFDLPLEENARRLAVLRRSYSRGTVTDEDIVEIFRGDEQGAAACRAQLAVARSIPEGLRAAARGEEPTF